ncbi:putative ABC transport system permease protein [Luteibacter rhizovicinus]|uniref:Putative ABC transport system permease protein n=1 Tax=Luteibacter rhizovicinus TaxID=242606 RepID=A0A4R3YQD3_9GAMM|nr:FtsX-like permease family protein [Luteibacter rhizovicinus]TCV95007.1 putative ABC transport system permease protein [Luteibacter rhizovicinus]
MQIKPILAALRRHKSGTILIALQIALTLAIVCNALFIIEQRVSRLSRTTGMDETNVIAIANRYVGPGTSFTPTVKTDLAAIRNLAGVEDAYATNSYPLRNGGWSMGVRLKPDAKKEITSTTLYFIDDHALKTLGVKLIEGRNFNAGEVISLDPRNSTSLPQVIITKALAQKLFEDGKALGKTIYLSQEGKPSTVIGVVEKLQVPWVGTWAGKFDQNAAMLPAILDSNYQNFVVRTRPGQQEAMLKALPKTLYATSRMRVIPEETGIRTFEQVRARAYETDRGMAILMGIVCAVLLAITAAGIVGLSSFWVGQRRKQIGVRRALGATKNDILSYFMTENFLIALGGVIVGSLLAVGMNQWLFTRFEMERLSLTYVAVGVVALLALGQAAVLAPALRASRVSPVEATRTV